VETDQDAPNGRVVLVDPMNPDPKNWHDVLPERSEPLQSVETAGGKLFASWRKDVATRAYVFDLTGKVENEIMLPGLGTAGGFEGLRDDKYVFYVLRRSISLNDLQVRHCYKEVLGVSQDRHSRFQSERVRDKAGVL
jgi:Serine proteases of the peptidase family S9A